jgi:hypothetical protein
MDFKEFKPKTFWEKPEGTTGMIFGALGLIAGGFGLYKLLPFLITLTQNLFTLIGLGLGLAGTIYVIADPKFRNLLFYAYKSVMRGATSIFITIDPIGIIENYVDTLKDNLRKINLQISNLRGQIEIVKEQITSNERQVKQNMLQVQAASKEPKRYALQQKLATRSAGRLTESNKTLKELLVKLEGLYRCLNKTQEAADFLIQDIEDDVSVKKIERKTILASHSAIKSAMKIINPKDDKKAMFDAALEFMAEDVGNKVGDIEHFMEVSEGFLSGVDLQNGIFEAQGWELLEQWEKEGSPVLKENKALLLARAADDNDKLDLDNPIVKEKIPRNNQFEGLFKS